MIDRATVQKIKDTARIQDVVKDYVSLSGRGPNYMALCPFHNERTPSFHVNTVRNFCYCFSCHTGGGPIDFLMKKEGITYPEALKKLADRYGIKVEEKELTDEEREKQSAREAMIVANEWAMKYFENSLFETEEGQNVGLSYIYDKRQLTYEAVKAFHLGFAPDSFNDFVEAAKSKGLRTEVLLNLGLIKRDEARGNLYAKYRNRVIFPIQNTSGKVVGFGGRALGNQKAKYINSEDSEIYHKKQELYGLFQAKDAIGKEKECILVEGYLDVIGMWQAGVRNVVASCGTALTPEQVKLIKRFTTNITIIYDGDHAGIEAAKKAIDLFLVEGFDVNVLILPDGHDPDSFAKIHSPEEIKEYIRTYRTDVMRFKINAEGADMNSPQKRYAMINSVVDSLALIADRMKRIVYVQDSSRLLGISEKELLDAVEAKRYNNEAKNRDEAIRERNRAQMQSASPSSTPPEANQSAGESNTEKRISNADTFLKSEKRNYPLLPLEWKVIQYCVRYGFCTFCIDENTMRPLSVFQYVEEELAGDGTAFSVPEFDEIFGIIRNLIPQYESDLTEFLANLEEKKTVKRNEGFREIGENYSTTADIQRAEQRLEEKLDEWEFDEKEEFSKAYIAKELSNHEMDSIRKFAVEALMERHQLSNIYSREMPAQREEDRLYRLLPAALSVWKNGIIDMTIKNLFSRLQEIAGKGNLQEEQDLQLQLARLLKERSEIAKNIGDRILSPPRGKS